MLLNFNASVVNELTLIMSIRCSAITANFSTIFFRCSWHACDTRTATSFDGSSSSCFCMMLRTLACNAGICKNTSSLHERIWVPISSVEPRMRCDSSAKFTPPIAATSLMSSSPYIEADIDDCWKYDVDALRSFSLLAAAALAAAAATLAADFSFAGFGVAGAGAGVGAAGVVDDFAEKYHS